MSGRALAAVLAAAGALTACGGDASGDARDPGADGPLEAGATAFTGSTALIPGRSVSVGLFVVRPEEDAGDMPIVLQRVRLASASPEVRLIGAVAAGTDRPMGAFTAERRWPPSARFAGATAPVSGYEVRPGAAMQRTGALVVLGLQADVLGRFEVREVVVDYRQGDRRFSERMPMRFSLQVDRRYP